MITFCFYNLSKLPAGFAVGDQKVCTKCKLNFKYNKQTFWNTNSGGDKQTFWNTNSGGDSVDNVQTFWSPTTKAPGEEAV